MEKAIAKIRIRHNGKLYLPGQEFDLNDKTKHLVECGYASVSDGVDESTKQDKADPSIDEVIKAIESVDPAKADLWTSEDMPKCEILTEIAGFTVTGQMRKEAYEIIDGTK